jgi:RND family efflux transporter MFP subunit
VEIKDIFMPERRRRFASLFAWLVAAAALSAAASSGCGRHGAADPTGGAQAPPSQTRVKRPVDLTQVRRERINSDLKTVGFLEAEGQPNIAAGVGGIVDEVLFREGDLVDRDTVLVKIDQKRFLAAVEVAKANEQRAQAALTLAQRMDQINIVSGSGISAEDKIKTNGGVRVSEGEYNSARAARVLAELNLARSQVRAPYAGQVNQKKVSPGDYLEEKTVVATMADLSRLRLVGFIPEKSAPLVRQLLQEEQEVRSKWVVGELGAWTAGPWCGLGAQASESAGEAPAKFRLQFTLGAYPSQTFNARIFFLSTVASADTHMFECKAEVSTRGLKDELRPGFTAKITVPLPGRDRVVVLPEESVRASERGDIVFRPKPVLKDGAVDYWIAEQVTVQVGHRAPGLVEIIDGLSDDDWVVRRGAETLEDGTPISFPDEQAAALKAR